MLYNPLFYQCIETQSFCVFAKKNLSLPPFSFLKWTPLVWRLHLVGDFSTIRTPSYCWNRDPNPSSFRCSIGSEPGGTSGIPYVYNPARHYTCGATSSWWPCRKLFIDNVPTEDVIPSSVYKDRVATGVIVDLRGIGDCRYDYTNHVHAGTFPA